MSHVGKNYTTDGGDTTVIGGSLVIEEGASVGGLPMMENQPASTASTIATLKEDFNALLTKLKTAGLMEADAEESGSGESSESE